VELRTSCELTGDGISICSRTTTAARTLLRDSMANTIVNVGFGLNIRSSVGSSRRLD